MIRRRWLRRFWSNFFPLCGQKVEVEHVVSCTSFKRLIRNFFSFFFLLIRKCCTMLSDAKPANRDSLHLIKVVHETQMNHLTNINCWRFVEVLPHYKFAPITKSLLHQRCKSLAPITKSLLHQRCKSLAPPLREVFVLTWKLQMKIWILLSLSSARPSYGYICVLLRFRHIFNFIRY